MVTTTDVIGPPDVPEAKPQRLDSLGRRALKAFINFLKDEGDGPEWSAGLGRETVAQDVRRVIDEPGTVRAPQTGSQAEIELPDGDPLDALRTAGERGELLLGWDGKCDCPKKDILLTLQGTALIEQLVQGPKSFNFMDLGHMSVPNRFRLEHLVDIFVEDIARLAKKHVVPQHGLLVRLGGDEFAFITRNTPEAKRAMQAYAAELRETAAALFDPEKVDDDVLAALNERRATKGEDPLDIDELRSRLDRARHFAAVRQAMRGPIRAEYEAQRLDKEPYDDYIRRRAREAGLNVDNDINSNQIFIDYATGWLEQHPRPDPDLCAPDFASIDAPGDGTISPQTYGQLTNTCDVMIHEQKNGHEVTVPETLVGLTANQHHEIEAFGAKQDKFLEHRYTQQHGATLSERTRATVALDAMRNSDATTGAIVRESLVTHPVEEGQIWHMYHFDVAHFGVINNQAGYQLADAALLTFSTIIRGMYPDIRLVRGRGGAMHAISDRELPTGQLDSLVQAISLGIGETLKDPTHEDRLAQYRKILDEAFERNTLEILLRRQLGDGRDPEYNLVGSISIRHAPVTVTAQHAHLGDVFNASFSVFHG